MVGNEQRGATVSQTAEGTPLPPVNPSVARGFLDLLKSVRGPLKLDRKYQFLSIPELEVRIAGTLDAVCAEVPGISRASLDAIIRNDPYAYPRWPVSARRRNPDMDWTLILDFPQLAAYWGNGVYDKEQAIAERNYGIGEIERHFLKAVDQEIRRPSA